MTFAPLDEPADRKVQRETEGWYGGNFMAMLGKLAVPQHHLKRLDDSRKPRDIRSNSHCEMESGKIPPYSQQPKRVAMRIKNTPFETLTPVTFSQLT